MNWKVPTWLLISAVVIYSACPLDLIPDVPIVGGIDDAVFAFLAAKKWYRDRDAAMVPGELQQVGPSHVTAMMVDDRPNREESPSLFSRAMKATSYIFNGGDL